MKLEQAATIWLIVTTLCLAILQLVIPQPGIAIAGMLGAFLLCFSLAEPKQWEKKSSKASASPKDQPERDKHPHKRNFENT